MESSGQAESKTVPGFVFWATFKEILWVLHWCRCWLPPLYLPPLSLILLSFCIILPWVIHTAMYHYELMTSFPPHFLKIVSETVGGQVGEDVLTTILYLTCLTKAQVRSLSVQSRIQLGNKWSSQLFFIILYKFCKRIELLKVKKYIIFLSFLSLGLSIFVLY